MRGFLKRALEKLDRLDAQNIRTLVTGLSQENELYDMVMDSMSEGIVVVDREGVIIMLNKAAVRLVPFTAAELPGRVLWEVMEDPDVADFLERELDRQERVLERDFTLEDDAGSTLVLSFSILPLVRQGEIRGSLINVEDVTEKRSKEARLRRAESLAALTTLTAGVAHEIKNPLASIGIHLQLIQKSLKGKESVSASELEPYVEIVGEEVDRLNMIVVDYLMAVRPSNGDLERGDINELIRELTSFLRFELQEAGVELTEEFSEVPKIEMDPKSLKQALLNLIKNAMGAMPDGGELWIGTSCTADRVTVKVRDTGTGIPEDIVEKIFEPYFTTK